jgi:PAS domain S-box-containing protein
MTETNDHRSTDPGKPDVHISEHEYRMLKQERAILREIRRRFPLTYFIFGIDGALLLQSDNLQRLTGWTFDEISQGHVAAYVDENDMAKVMTTLKKASSLPGEDVEASYSVNRKDGSSAPCEAHIIYLADDPDILGYLGITHIVDRQKVLEDENLSLKSQIARMQQLDAVGTLASGIAHDFNNVLQAVIGNAELAFEDLPPDSTAAGYMEGIFKAGQLGRDLVTKLLTYARKRPMEKRVIELSPCVHDAIDLLRVAVPPGMRFITDIDKDVGYIWDDSINLHQLVLNLGTNAVAAVAGVAEEGEVTISLEKIHATGLRKARLGALHGGAYAKLTVKDNGTGMDDATLSKIFEPFFTTKEIGQGTGLGLAVVAGIVDAQGGALDIRSTPGGGTAVDVFIPLISRDEAMTRRLVDVMPEGHEAIAIIDDDPGVLFVGRTFLERLGYKPTHYSSARAFLADIENRKDAFDVVVSDLTMPEMSGIQLARHLDLHHPNLPVILTSGFDDPLLTVASPPASIKAVLRKPYGAVDIGRVIQRVCRG